MKAASSTGTQVRGSVCICRACNRDTREFLPTVLEAAPEPSRPCGAQIIEATLAFFEDTGWYSANYSAISFVPYGHNRGAMSALKE